MKTYLKRLLSLSVVALAALLMAGCSRSSAASVQTSSEAIDGAQYRKAEQACNYDRSHAQQITIKIRKGSVDEADLNNSVASFALKRWKTTTVKCELDQANGLVISETKLVLPVCHMKKRTVATRGQIGYDAKSGHLVILMKDQKYKHGFYLLGKVKRAVPETASLVKMAGKGQKVELSCPRSK